VSACHPVIGGLLAASFCVLHGVALAQGNRGAPPGQLKKAGAPPATAEDSIVEPVGAGPRVRGFGVWLDDATLAPPRSVWITAGFTRWSTPIATGVDAPAIGLAAGLSPRAQLTLSVSRSRARFADGPDAEAVTGLGSLYAGLKLRWRDPAKHDVGVSVTPAIEVLSAESAPDGSSRVSWVLPLSMEVGRGPTRAYGSAGFFGRGAAFASVAVERHVSPRVALTGALSQSWSTSGGADADALGLSTRRTDVSGGVTAFLSPTAAVFVSAGRTISRPDFDSARLVLAAGFLVGIGHRTDVPARPPR
jgi:hypothetical protein